MFSYADQLSEQGLFALAFMVLLLLFINFSQENSALILLEALSQYIFIRFSQFHNQKVKKTSRSVNINVSVPALLLKPFVAVNAHEIFTVCQSSNRKAFILSRENVAWSCLLAVHYGMLCLLWAMVPLPLHFSQAVTYQPSSECSLADAQQKWNHNCLSSGHQRLLERGF